MDAQKICANCRFADVDRRQLPPHLRAYQASLGAKCRRYAPHGGGTFPRVRKTDWCGEWQPIEEGGK